MSLRCLRIPALLVLALPLVAQTQSLGDLAREFRSERQQSGASQPKVYTNDDVVTPSGDAAPAVESNDQSSNDQSGQEGQPAGKAAAPAAKAKLSPEKAREQRELELDKRTQQLNQVYLDKIASIRAQISAAQQEIARLQRDQVESSFEFQRSSGTNPSVLDFQEQQRTFNEQIAAQRELLVSLGSQLEDAQESARHAGVPHATDY